MMTAVAHPLGLLAHMTVGNMSYQSHPLISIDVSPYIFLEVKIF